MSPVHPAPPQTYREVERKLRVHGLYRLPDLADAEGTAVVAQTRTLPALELAATYYDTGDLRLARSHVTLRRRAGGVDDGWHLKLPAEATGGEADAAVRDEVRLPPDTGDAPPAELLQLVLGVTRGAEVEPVATLRTERRPYELLAPDGRVIAELTDDTVSVLDGTHVAARFRELEVETRDGSQDEIDAVIGALVRSGAVEGGLPSKAVRALGPAALAPPDVPPPDSLPPSGPNDPAGAAVRAHLVRNTSAFLAQDLRVRRGLPDSVHQMRVAARRLRSGLKVFAPLVDQEWSDELRTELAWIAAELGHLRDREVLEARLLTHLAALPSAEPEGSSGGGAGAAPAGSPGQPPEHGRAGVDRTDRRDVAAAQAVVRRVFDAEHPAAQAGLDEALRSQRYVRLMALLVAGAREPRLTPAADEPAVDVLPELLGKAWRRLAKDAKRLHPDGTDDSWHETRIAAKRARYAAEALTPVFGGPARKLAKQLERVTELLGEHQDAVIAARTARELAAGRRVTGTTGFVLGLLHESERAAVTRARAGFAKIWPDIVHGPGPRRLGHPGSSRKDKG